MSLSKSVVMPAMLTPPLSIGVILPGMICRSHTPTKGGVTPDQLALSPAEAVCQLGNVSSVASPQMPTVVATGLFRTLLFEAPAAQPVAGVVFTLPMA